MNVICWVPKLVFINELYKYGFKMLEQKSESRDHTVVCYFRIRLFI